MYLKDFLDKLGILPSNFAKALKTYPNAIFKIFREGHIPSLKVAMMIEQATEGKVTCQEIYKECLLAKEKYKKMYKKTKNKNRGKTDK